jgi:hypothetical protein
VGTAEVAVETDVAIDLLIGLALIIVIELYIKAKQP